jgi:hypothetical protein
MDFHKRRRTFLSGNDQVSNASHHDPPSPQGLQEEGIHGQTDSASRLP